MAINKALFAVFVLCCASGAVWSREAASPADCQAAAAQPAVANAKAALDRNPADARPVFALADAWSDAGCFNESLRVLQNAQSTHPLNKELETRIRVARSLVGEEHFFDNLDRANDEAKLKRQSFRCTSLADLDACNDAVTMKPNDAGLLAAQGDALMQAQRPADAVVRYRHASALAPGNRDLAAKITAAESRLGSAANAPAAEPQGKIRMAGVANPGAPSRQYSNAAPETRSH